MTERSIVAAESVGESVSRAVIEWLGFAWFFVGTALIGAPVALLCWAVWAWQTPVPARP